jgi:RNA polymerase sigma factor for flagellar operon FliA
MSPDGALILWRRYRASKDPQLRDRLVMTFAPLVKYIVFRKVRELPARCEVEDFIAAGLEAVLTSLDRYDPEKGASLEQFLWTRIHGAVLDELRRQDWAPRSLRRWERDIARTREQYINTHGRRPTSEELAGALAVSERNLRMREQEIAASEVTSLNSLVMGEEETSVERIDTLVSSEPDPEQQATTSAAKDRFRRAFDQLPQREREIAVFLYVNNLTLREVGEILGVSESRVCQIHNGLKQKLRARLEDESSLFAEVA